jgi:hypothetical protein
VIRRFLGAIAVSFLLVGSWDAPLAGQDASPWGSVPMGSGATGEALRLLGPGDGTPLDGLRRGYLLAVDVPEALPPAVAELARLEAELRAEGLADPLLLAYGGALEVLRARDARWPPTRIAHLQRGMEILDRAVRSSPGSAEIRAIRLMTEVHLPGMFLRDEVVRRDEEFLMDSLKHPGHDLTAGMERIVIGFLRGRG